jgi:hypothetical protein
MRTSAFLAAITILVTTGFLHGLWTDRWGFSDEPEASAAKLARVPTTIEDWTSTPLEIGSRELEKSAIVNYVGRLFVNSKTKNRVQVFLVCGRPGPISVHTPDICFEGAGYRMTAPPEKFALANLTPNETNLPPSEFWQTTFVKNGLETQERVRVFWSWNADGRWQAPENPRPTFARSKALFKLYVINELARPGLTPEKDPGVDLMKKFLPELKKCLFPES